MPTIAPATAVISIAERQREPEREAELDRDHGGRIGADRHQGDVADGDLAGEAFDDVEADRQDDVDRHHVDDELRVGVGERGAAAARARCTRSATARSDACRPNQARRARRPAGRISLLISDTALGSPRALARRMRADSAARIMASGGADSLDGQVLAGRSRARTTRVPARGCRSPCRPWCTRPGCRSCCRRGIAASGRRRS